MKKVAIIMGSDSDLPTAEKAATELKKLEIPFEVHVMSAHRTRRRPFQRTPSKTDSEL